MVPLESTEDLLQLKEKINNEHKTVKRWITICSGTGCIAYKANEIAVAIKEELDQKELTAEVKFRQTGCHGFCEQGPIIVILPEKICYVKIKKDDVAEIIEKTIINNEVVERLTFKDPNTGKHQIHVDDIPFYALQTRILLANNIYIDPTDIKDYLAIGGYSTLAAVLTRMDPIDIIETMKDANLRGRGGGGFPAGVKWETTRNAEDKQKYVIVNADEGDPGAYMDRSVLEGNPHSVLEGLMIGGYAIGASEGFIYVREEYPLALENTQKAIDQLHQYGLLGNNILNSGFSFTITIHKGAGAFVSGESSALMSAIEGRVGEPRPKYIHTSVKGLWDKPSCLNNVETWANVPFIISQGVEWFKSIGTDTSKGTKIFSLVGKVNCTGLVEVPMGLTLRDIVYKIGGGIPNGKKFKAIQTGGPSGGVLPDKLLDLPVDFDKLYEAGSMMGSGGMIVMDENTCMVDTARYYINFLTHESCGKCVPCREGLRQMLAILNNICEGKGSDGDLELLEELAETIMEASLCALGKTAPNPVLSTLKYFRDEYNAHIVDKQCPALMCDHFIMYQINQEKCTGCGLCEKHCPVQAILKIDKKKFSLKSEECIKCGACLITCPPKFNAIEKVPDLKVRTVSQ